MVDALLALQGQTVRLQQFAECDPSEPPESFGAFGPRPMVLLATCYCILFGYHCERTAPPVGLTGLKSEAEPEQPGDFVSAFHGVLRKPQEFLQDLLALRAQLVSVEKLMTLAPLAQDTDLNPEGFRGEYQEMLQHLVAFVRAVVECAEIYNEIREFAATGRMDQLQASQLLDGVESDQKRMINAMGGRVGPEEDDVEENLCME